jgi:hypothetical protein
MRRERHVCIAAAVAAGRTERELLERRLERPRDHRLGLGDAAAPPFAVLRLALGLRRLLGWSGVEAGQQRAECAVTLGGLAAPHGGGIEPVAGAVRGLVAARREDALDQRRLLLAGVVEPDGAADVLERVARQRLLDDRGQAGALALGERVAEVVHRHAGGDLELEVTADLE